MSACIDIYLAMSDLSTLSYLGSEYAFEYTPIKNRRYRQPRYDNTEISVKQYKKHQKYVNGVDRIDIFKGHRYPIGHKK